MAAVDLSHPIDHGTRTYPGFPPVSISDYWDHDNEGWQISQVTFVSSSGTYLDAPLHRHPQGLGVADLPLSSCVDLPGIKIVAHEAKIESSITSVGPEDLAGRAVLINTGWADKWGSPEYREQGKHPGLSGVAVDHLLEAGVRLVGIDSLNIDYLADESDDVNGHNRFLDAGVPIVEQLTNLASLPTKGFRFSAAPLALVATGSCPVRAYAIVPDTA